MGGKMGIVGCEQFAVGGKRSIVRAANGSMLAVASRSIARFALLEYRFAVEDGRGLSSEWRSEERAECYGSG